MQALDRIVDPDRQLREHRGHLVAAGAVAGHAHRHRDHRLDLQGAHVDPAGCQQLPEAARDSGEDDVVHRTAEGVLHRLDRVEVTLDPAPAAVLADGPTQRGLGAQQAAAHGGASDGSHRHVFGELTGMADAADDPREVLTGPHHRIDDRIGHQADGSGCGLRFPGARRGLAALRVGVEDDLHDVVAGQPVDHRVVRLVDQRPAALRQSLDQPDLPQGAIEVEPL